jgi:cyanophycinase
MKPSVHRSRLFVLGLCAALVFIFLDGSMMTAQSPEPLLIAIGGGYTDTYDGFLAAVFARAGGDTVNITVLPPAYSSSAERIGDDERGLNMQDAEHRRAQLEEACTRRVPAGRACRVRLAPVFTRADAENPANLAFFDAPDGVFVLGGDQSIAMQVLMDTPLETALAAAYARGAVIAGTSAGLAVQSRAMIAGYAGDENGPANALNEGAVLLWNDSTRRGLSFGVTRAILEQHFWERARAGRLLNALAQPGVPHVGLGVDGYTAVQVRGGTRLEGVFGLYTAAVFDAETFGAAEKAAYPGGLLDMRNVLFHMLAPGDFSYDLETRQFSLAAPPDSAERDFSALALPDGAGPLLLTGGLPALPLDHPVWARLLEWAGGGKILVIVLAPPDDGLGERISAQLGETVSADFAFPLADPETFAGLDLSPYTALLMTGEDASLIEVSTLARINETWRAGKPLALDDAAAAVAGAFYAAHPPTPDEAAEREAAVQGSLIQGGTTVRPGLGLLDAAFVPRLMADNRWGRLVALAYAHPDRLAFGLNDGAVLEITAAGARVTGTNSLIALDLRGAALALGTNGGLVIANGWLDVFAPGTLVQDA